MRGPQRGVARLCSFAVVAVAMAVMVVAQGCSDDKNKPAPKVGPKASDNTTEPPKLMDEHAAAVKDAVAAFEKALAAADKQLVDAMDDAVKRIAQAGDLDGAQRVREEKSAFEKSGVQPTAPQVAEHVQTRGDAIKRAREKLLAAFDLAIDGYTRTVQLDKALALRSRRSSWVARWEPSKQTADPGPTGKKKPTTDPSAKKPEPPAALDPLVKDAVLLYTFDKDTRFEKDGRTLVRDLSDQKNHGVSVGAAFVDGKVGQACRIDEPSLFVVSTMSVGIVGARPRTIAFWLKDQIVHKAKQHQAFVGWGVDGNYKQFRIATERKRRYGIWTWGKDWSPPIDRREGWAHHVITYDSQFLRWYIDGEDTGESWEKALATGDSSLRISRGAGTHIDELVVLPRALDRQGVKALYALSQAGLRPRAAAEKD